MRRPWIETRHRGLLDVLVSGAEPALLGRMDAEQIADAFEAAGFESVLLYSKAHTGHLFWPARVGTMHPSLVGRDMLGDLVAAFHGRDINIGAYHSTAIDNVAWNAHPAWRVENVGTEAEGMFFGGRAAGLCLNNAEYREYEVAQVSELVERYPLDGLFIDIASWLGVCGCPICRERCLRETGTDIPTTRGSGSPEWRAFERAQCRWSAEFCDLLRSTARGIRPDLISYSNGATTPHAQYSGRGFDSLQGDSFAGGDLYGGRDLQIMSSKLFRSVGRGARPEYIVQPSSELGHQIELKDEWEIRQQAHAALALDSALMINHGPNADGTVDRTLYELVGRALAPARARSAYAGGIPVEDVGVYYSDLPGGDPDAPIRSITDPPLYNSPHSRAWEGACRALLRAHLPYGAVTRYQIDDLDRYRVLVVPDLPSLSDDEQSAIRAYVHRGGRLYASGSTSLLDADGGRRNDFGLADLFGVRFVGVERGKVVYARIEDPALAEAAAPQRELAHFVQPPGPFLDEPVSAVPRVVAESAVVRARLSLPWDYPHTGDIADGRWIWNDPPWEATALPFITTNAVGAGTVVYSVAPIEERPRANARVFVHLVRELLGGPASVEIDAHPDVLAETWEQPERGRLVIHLVDFPDAGPPIPTTARVVLRGRPVTAIEYVGTPEPARWEVTGEGVEIRDIPVAEATTVVVHCASRL